MIKKERNIMEQIKKRFSYILNYIKCTYGFPVYGEGEKPSIQKTDGTNWSAIGVGY